jgi:hypothetical protein
MNPRDIGAGGLTGGLGNFRCNVRGFRWEGLREGFFNALVSSDVQLLLYVAPPGLFQLVAV